MSATITALHLSHAARARLTPVSRAEAITGRGLDGDRHARTGNRRSILLMQHEVLDTLGLAPGDVREQVTVRGLDLNALAEGSRLKVGAAVLVVGQPCAPCERMEELRPGLRTVLDGQRGRFVQVVTAGAVAVGDAIEVQPPA
jgi:MOSC domain-containing protein YiiM